MAKLMVISRCLSGGTKVRKQRASVRVAGIVAEI
jgi:hypothetical protein